MWKWYGCNLWAAPCLDCDEQHKFPHRLSSLAAEVHPSKAISFWAKLKRHSQHKSSIRTKNSTGPKINSSHHPDGCNIQLLYSISVMDFLKNAHNTCNGYEVVVKWLFQYTCLWHYSISYKALKYCIRSRVCELHYIGVYFAGCSQCFTQTGCFFHSERKCTRFYIHSCWPFIQFAFFGVIGWPWVKQEEFLLSTETQINHALNQINADLKWVVSINTLKMSPHNQFE